MLFQVSFERFMEEVRRENISSETRNKVEKEDFGNLIAYYLVPFELRKQYVFVATKDELPRVHMIRLEEISEPSKRITDSSSLKNISNTLIRLEEEFKKGTVREIIRETVTEKVIEE